MKARAVLTVLLAVVLCTHVHAQGNGTIPEQIRLSYTAGDGTMTIVWNTLNSTAEVRFNWLIVLRMSH